MSRSTLDRLSLYLCLVLAAGLAWAATPPPLVNYQGVLRAADDTPLEGGPPCP